MLHALRKAQSKHLEVVRVLSLLHAPRKAHEVVRILFLWMHHEVSKSFRVFYLCIAFHVFRTWVGICTHARKPLHVSPGGVLGNVSLPSSHVPSLIGGVMLPCMSCADVCLNVCSSGACCLRDQEDLSQYTAILDLAKVPIHAQTNAQRRHEKSSFATAPKARDATSKRALVV